MKYTIEFELPDNETVLKYIKRVPVSWRIWGFSGDAIAKPIDSKMEQVGDCISRQAAFDAIKGLPSAQSDSCKGCKHIGMWENEIEYGYPSPCTRCKRRVNDNYER